MFDDDNQNIDNNNESSSLKFKDWIKINRWIVFLLVVASAVTTIFYISNVLAVNDLLEHTQKLEKQVQELRTSNELLNAKVIQLQSAERITSIAEQKLFMQKPLKAPELVR